MCKFATTGAPAISCVLANRTLCLRDILIHSATFSQSRKESPKLGTSQQTHGAPVVGWQVLVEALLRLGAVTPDRAVERPAFREECRKQIGDTGALLTSYCPRMTHLHEDNTWHRRPFGEYSVPNVYHSVLGHLSRIRF